VVILWRWSTWQVLLYFIFIYHHPPHRDNVTAPHGRPKLKVGYTSATTGRGDLEVHKGHVVALDGEKNTACMKLLQLNGWHKAVNSTSNYQRIGSRSSSSPCRNVRSLSVLTLPLRFADMIGVNHTRPHARVVEESCRVCPCDVAHNTHQVTATYGNTRRCTKPYGLFVLYFRHQRV
jgi:hypothetical protein